jgi:hypothetical protein
MRSVVTELKNEIFDLLFHRDGTATVQHGLVVLIRDENAGVNVITDNGSGWWFCGLELYAATRCS